MDPFDRVRLPIAVLVTRGATIPIEPKGEEPS